MDTVSVEASSQPIVKRSSLYDMLRDQAIHNADAVAITAPGYSSISYGALLTQVDELSKTLDRLEIRRNDRVAVVLPNGPEMAAAFLGVASVATCAPINPAYRAAEFEFFLADLNAKALMVKTGMDSPAIDCARRRRIPIITLPSTETGGPLVFSPKNKRRRSVSDRVASGTDNVALVLYTSGTTSRPKLVPLTSFNLLASARNVATALELTGSDRCLNVMPLFHIHGLVGALLSSLVAGSSVVCAPGFEATDFVDWLGEFRPTWYTAVPTIHQAVLSAARSQLHTFSGHSLRFIRSASAGLPTQLMRGLEDTFHVPVIEAYGMTEASHQICSNKLPPGERKPSSVGIPIATEVAVIDHTGKVLQPYERGEIVLRGPTIMRGYLGDAAADERAFFRSWLRTGDQGYFDADDYLFITGRLDDLINRGGEKISPREIEETLLHHDDVAEAVAFSLPHPSLGENIGIAVVCRAGRSLTESDVREFLLQRLAAFKVPSRIWIVEEIPKGATGKIKRSEIAAFFAARSKREPVVPKSDYETAVAGIYADVLGTADIGRGDNFFALGGDSLRATQVLSRIRARFKVNLSIATIFSKATVSGLADEIGRALIASQDRGKQL